MSYKYLSPYGRGRSEPFSSFQSVLSPWEDLIHSLYERTGSSPNLNYLNPSVDISETDKEITFTVELPGVSEDNVEVSISNNLLTIKGEKTIDRTEKNKNYHSIERASGSFIRSFQLPFAVQADQISAECDKGILTIHVPKPKSEGDKSAKIKIKASK